MRIQNSKFNSEKITGKENSINNLIAEILSRKIIDSETHNFIADFVNKSEVFKGDEKVYFKELDAFEKTLLKEIEKKYKLVKKDYYTNLWTAVGMSAFGVPIGVAFGSIFKNMAFIGIGLPIGLVIGRLVGSNLDKKALKENRQLDIK
ncbi:hypothetical protein FLJC2902T_22270 [Flavobacterium limnosediminis JC2902]|uniref:Uncharacterized protein n=1 Tax=Flavobacterium limnosediminis JC2902 TaxID=1341181 RepID=V6SKZ5_9FLAO|nr:hypothetical protein [Flavobacterium limnosediminis]ESU27119.1 hypothetical protein FLJC2902T_22270 [Flavobacterium limnosediminis JC2902]